MHISGKPVTDIYIYVSLLSVACTIY